MDSADCTTFSMPASLQQMLCQKRVTAVKNLKNIKVLQCGPPSCSFFFLFFFIWGVGVGLRNICGILVMDKNVQNCKYTLQKSQNIMYTLLEGKCFALGGPSAISECQKLYWALITTNRKLEQQIQTISYV